MRLLWFSLSPISWYENAPPPTNSSPPLCSINQSWYQQIFEIMNTNLIQRWRLSYSILIDISYYTYVFVLTTYKKIVLCVKFYLWYWYIIIDSKLLCLLQLLTLSKHNAEYNLSSLWHICFVLSNFSCNHSAILLCNITRCWRCCPPWFPSSLPSSILLKMADLVHKSVTASINDLLDMQLYVYAHEAACVGVTFSRDLFSFENNICLASFTVETSIDLL